MFPANLYIINLYGYVIKRLVPQKFYKVNFKFILFIFKNFIRTIDVATKFSNNDKSILSDNCCCYLDFLHNYGSLS